MHILVYIHTGRSVRNLIFIENRGTTKSTSLLMKNMSMWHVLGGSPVLDEPLHTYGQHMYYNYTCVCAYTYMYTSTYVCVYIATYIHIDKNAKHPCFMKMQEHF